MTPTRRVQTADMTRAPKGGVEGVNGFLYSGGKFLPSNPLRPPGSSSPERQGKQVVGVGEWAFAPNLVDDEMSLYRVLEVIGAGLDVKRGQTPTVNPAPLMLTLPQAAQDEAARLVDLYAGGERWTRVCVVEAFIVLTGRTRETELRYDLGSLSCDLKDSINDARMALPHNAFVIAALRQMGFDKGGWAFGDSILADLTVRGLGFFDLPERAQYIMSDMYARHFGGKSGSRSHTAAMKLFEDSVYGPERDREASDERDHEAHVT